MYNPICNYFVLGKPIGSPTRVQGGLMNKMWRLDTESGSYAVKQISKDINLHDPAIRSYYELTETIAHRFSKLGIPAVSALEKNGRHFFDFDGDGFLVYPWVNAKTLESTMVAEQHAVIIAAILAKLHMVDLDVPELQDPGMDGCQTGRLLKLIQQAADFKCPFSADLQKHKSMLAEANDASQGALVILSEQTVVGHGDLDPKNVLWDDRQEPFLVDWECARKINPTYEILNTLGRVRTATYTSLSPLHTF